MGGGVQRVRLAAFLFVVGVVGAHARVDTATWVGAEYTPASAPANSLWWHWFEDYEASVERELAAANKVLGIKAIRIFLHSMVYFANSSRLLRNLDRFLTIAASNHIRVGLVFFGDCFNRAGASLEKQCVPVKARHNGCWMASPQDIERTNVDRFRPYVIDVVGRFKEDERVLWWEIFNEPGASWVPPGRLPGTSWAPPGHNLTFSLHLRKAAYGWAKEMHPMQPVLSCWDDNNATDIVDHHDYGTGFKSSWMKAIFSNPAKGALVTEAGSRWYQQPFSSDQGSPLTVINFLESLKRDPSVPFVPGAMICWELMVGNSNTRWHWSTKDGTVEPAIPWDAWLFPDGTPISHTEAGALRRYISGQDEFISFSDFLPREVADGDKFLTLTAGQQWHAKVSGDGHVADALVETAFWTDQANGSFSLVVRCHNRTGPAAVGLDGYHVVVKGSQLRVDRQQDGQRANLGTFDLSKLENGVVTGAWNMLRVLIVGGMIDVWFNPMFPETGFVGTSEDSRKVPQSLPTRISVQDAQPLPSGGIAAVATIGVARMDYISALPPGVAGLGAHITETQSSYAYV